MKSGHDKRGQGNEEGSVSFLALCLLMVFTIFGGTLLYTVRANIGKHGFFLEETALRIAAESGMEREIAALERDSSPCRGKSESETFLLAEWTEDGIQTRVYGRRKGDRLILLARAQKESAFPWICQTIRQQVSGCMRKEDTGCYVWERQLH